jgi:hypothetical protein
MSVSVVPGTHERWALSRSSPGTLPVKSKPLGTEVIIPEHFRSLYISRYCKRHQHSPKTEWPLTGPNNTPSESPLLRAGLILIRLLPGPGAAHKVGRFLSQLTFFWVTTTIGRLTYLSTAIYVPGTHSAFATAPIPPVSLILSMIKTILSMKDYEDCPLPIRPYGRQLRR